MPLFQPTNIVPSTFAGQGGGVADASSNLSVSWQVNGNVPMTAFRIYIYDSTGNQIYDSTFQDIVSTPFYPRDQKGNPNVYTFSPSGVTWASAGLTNGNEYTLKIVQAWGNNATVGNRQKVTQYSESAFITRSAPTVSITEDSVTTVEHTFSATYQQAEGDPLYWVRWVLSLVGDGTSEVIFDTGEIDTGVLGFTYDGFISGNDYSLSCTVETANGVQATDTYAFTASYTESVATGGITLSCGDACAELSWAEATEIQGEASSAEGYSVDDSYITLDSGETVTWDTVNDDSMDFTTPYQFAWKGKRLSAIDTGSGVSFNSDQRITKIAMSGDGKTMAAVFGAGIYDQVALFEVDGSTVTQRSIAYNSESNARTVYNIALNGDGSLLLIGCNSPNAGSFGNVYLYEIADYEATEAEVLSTEYNQAEFAFSDDAQGLFVAGRNYYTYSGGVLSAPVPFDSSHTTYDAEPSIFSADGTLLCHGKNVYSVSGTTFTKIYTLQDGGSASFSPDGKYLAVCQTVRGNGIYLYKIEGLNLTYLGQNEASDGNHSLLADHVSFDSTGKMVALSCSYNQPGGSVLNRGVRIYYVKEDAGDRPLQLSQIAVSSYRSGGSVSDPVPGMAFTDRLYCTGIYKNTSSPVNEVYPIRENGNIFTISGETDTVTFSEFGTDYKVEKNGNVIANIQKPYGVSEMIVGLRSDDNLGQVLYWIGYGGETYVGSMQTDPLFAIRSIQIGGYQVCDYVFLTSDHSQMFDADFDHPNYNGDVLFFADFTEGLQAGTFSEAGTIQNAVYQIKDGVSRSLGKFPTAVTSLRDFGVRSQQKYSFGLYYYDGSVYSNFMESEAEYCNLFPYHTLMETVVDQNDPNVYHVLKYWKFGNNVENMDVSNGNEPNFLENFTKYPLRQKSSQAPKSGTLQALLSNTENHTYADSAEQMERLYDISLSDNTFFLRDSKGNLYMVHTSGAITETVNFGSQIQEVTVQIPWTEVGSADNVSVIQLPTDPGWNEEKGTVIPPTVIEEKTVDLDMSVGDQVIYPSENATYMSEVTVIKPETMIPANIVNGVDIGGVIGNAQAVIGMKDINFMDYDGNIVAAYTVAEAQGLTSLPVPPTHDDLEFQGWTHTLAEVNALQSMRMIGAVYITKTGATLLKIDLTNPNALSPQIRFIQSAANGVTVNWGDGSASATYAGTSVSVSHTYGAVGKYTISLLPASGITMTFGNGTANASVMGLNNQNVYRAALKEVNIGTGVNETGSYAFMNLILERASIPNYCSVSDYAFTGSAIPQIVIGIPSQVSSDTSDGVYAFNNCNGLKYAVGLGIVIAASTYVDSSSFYNCRSLREIEMRRRGVGDNQFYNCLSLNRFYCNQPRFNSVGENGFRGCIGLSEIKLSFTSISNSIGSNAFNGANGIVLYDFTDSSHVPSLANTNAFTGIRSDCKMVVPDELYDSWVSETNWSTYASYIVKKSDYTGHLIVQ